MSNKHTPGPWTVEHLNELAPDILYIVPTHSPNLLSALSVIYPGLDKEESRQNSRLMAASPDLLEACKALHDALSAILEDTDNTILGASLRKQANKAVNISFRAIAKAEKGE